MNPEMLCRLVGTPLVAAGAAIVCGLAGDYMGGELAEKAYDESNPIPDDPIEEMTPDPDEERKPSEQDAHPNPTVTEEIMMGPLNPLRVRDYRESIILF